MQRSKIEWTTFTANPIVYERQSDGKRVWACVKKSPGCKHCYAEALAKRYGKGAEFNEHEMAKLSVLVDDRQLRRILLADRVDGVKVEGAMVFIGDMTDIFGDWVPFELLDRLFCAIALRPEVTFQVLTKRPDRMRAYIERLDASTKEPGYGAWPKLFEEPYRYLTALIGEDRMQRLCERDGLSNTWPMENLWLGTSCERQQEAEERCPDLVATPAVVRFISAEPLLELVDLRRWLRSWDVVRDHGSTGDVVTRLRDGIGLVIGGGESGAGARPCDIGWLQSLVEQVDASMGGSRIFLKQLGSKALETFEAHESDPRVIGDGWTLVRRNDTHGRLQWYRYLKLRSYKGSDPKEWPRVLTRRPAGGSVRELPEVRA